MTDPHTLPLMEGNVLKTLDVLEGEIIRHALDVTEGNVAKAARALGIGRATMYRKTATPHEPASDAHPGPVEAGLEDPEDR